MATAIDSIGLPRQGSAHGWRIFLAIRKDRHRTIRRRCGVFSRAQGEIGGYVIVAPVLPGAAAQAGRVLVLHYFPMYGENIFLGEFLSIKKYMPVIFANPIIQLVEGSFLVS
jgi:hypothetical protein